MSCSSGMCSCDSRIVKDSTRQEAGSGVVPGPDLLETRRDHTVSSKPSIKSDNLAVCNESGHEKELRADLESLAGHLRQIVEAIQRASGHSSIPVPKQLLDALHDVQRELNSKQHSVETASRLLLQLCEPLHHWRRTVIAWDLQRRHHHSASPSASPDKGLTANSQLS